MESYVDFCRDNVSQLISPEPDNSSPHNVALRLMLRQDYCSESERKALPSWENARYYKQNFVTQPGSVPFTSNGSRSRLRLE